MRQQSLVIIFCFLLAGINAHAQKVTGAFYGRADVMNTGGNSNNYLTELVIKQKGNEVEGIFGYYFKDSYQSFFVRGTYDPKTRLVHIKNLPVLFYRSDTRNGIECPMNFMGTLLVSKAGSSISGSFYTEDRYKYTCPELRVNYRIDENADLESSMKASVAGQKLWKPQEEDFVVTTADKSETKTIAADAKAQRITGTDSSAIPVPIAPSNNVSSSNSSAATGPIKPVIDSTLIKKEKEKQEKLVKAFEARKNSYMKDIVVESDSLRVSFYDNGDIDGDFISVFLNGKPVLTGKELSARAMNVYIELEKGMDYNELSMFAENLGKFPPNTALMVITDGINRHELYLSSSLTQNAAVRIRRK